MKIGSPLILAFSHIVTKRQAGGSHIYYAMKQVPVPRSCSVMCVFLSQALPTQDPCYGELGFYGHGPRCCSHFDVYALSLGMGGVAGRVM